MKNVLMKIKSILSKYKKRIIIVSTVFVLCVLGASVASGAYLYDRTKTNIKYSEKQCEEVALKQIPGEVIKVEKDLEFEDSAVEYEFKIKDKNNVLREVTVDATSGAIVDVEDDFHDDRQNTINNKVENKNIQEQPNNAI